ncbi:unnamed protein product [Caenorhabditis angaria]|uniref:Potassium channel tetramerisation-type BTB domain-containing protein n=1 Tax=Caenorhabditis angaria TaxID=860376 RepID=A0A9P1J584_9PELO|nr:unnamed protein product [Caenorhabditis angaria]
MLKRVSLGQPGYNNQDTRGGIDPRKEDLSTHHGRDLVHINASGTRYTTILDTLVQTQSSYFSNFIRVDRTSGQVQILQKRVMIDETGAIFINRDGHLFSHVLQYMRDGRNTILPNDENLLRRLEREADFFGMDGLKGLVVGMLITIGKQKENDSLAAIRNAVSQIANNIYYSNGVRK